MNPGSAVKVLVLGVHDVFQLLTTSFWKFSTPMPAAWFATWMAWRMPDSATKWTCAVRR